MAYNSGYRGADSDQIQFPPQQTGMHHYTHFQQNHHSDHHGIVICHPGGNVTVTTNIYYGLSPFNEPPYGYPSNILASQHPSNYEQYPSAPNHFTPRHLPFNHNHDGRPPLSPSHNPNNGRQAPRNRPYRSNNSGQPPQNHPQNKQSTQSSSLNHPSGGTNGVRLSPIQPSINQLASNHQSRPQITSSGSIPSHQGLAVTIPSIPEALHPVTLNNPKGQQGSSINTPVPSQSLVDTKSLKPSNLNDTKSQQQETREHSAINISTQNVTSMDPVFLPAYDVFRKGDQGHIEFYFKQDSRTIQSIITRLCRQLYEKGIRSVEFGFNIGRIYNLIFFDDGSSTESVSDQSASGKPIAGQPSSHKLVSDPLITDQSSSNQLSLHPQFLNLRQVDSASPNLQPHKGLPAESGLTSQLHSSYQIRTSHTELACPGGKSTKGQGIYQNALAGPVTQVYPYPNLDGKAMANSSKSAEFVKSWIMGLAQADIPPIIINSDGNISNKRKRKTDSDNSGPAAARQTTQGVRVDANDSVVEQKAPAHEQLDSQTKVDGLRRSKRTRKSIKKI